ncbi:hypothetical protein [Actinomadura livida]|uniref:Uncharacterized protein n=1 Tax=Actinomadura livida TaxID=79909 RepID=A0A7W7MVY4_9ACTN|nr:MULTISPECIES: hypothetical protein [Actinomadura]MBB4772294.1 hypothetical protein [Actinomadura catellatispora]GGU28301.1 hypothetical protein GCM10010208_61490 [Actinomadura livida]
MTGTMRAPRSRGMISGLLLVLLAIWGGLIPFIGPYFDFGFGSDQAWVYTADRLVLSILPAVAVGLGGLILLATANRPVAQFGGWLAAAGGLWFVVGNTVAALWNMGVGAPLGGEGRQVAEQMSFFEGLGAVMILLAGLALGRFLVIGIREARQAGMERRLADDRVGAGDRGEATAVPTQQKRGHFHLGRQKAGASAGKERHTTSRRD